MKKVSQWLYSYEWIAVALIALVFIAIRIPGADLPLHQDEYKWPMIVDPALSSDTEIPHPPLSQFIYRTAGAVVGFDVDFRYVPLIFGTLNLFLLFYLLRMYAGRAAAFFGIGIFTISYFSVLASLMVDTDGQIMPFFFLCALISYYKAREFRGRARALWLVGLALACVLGFMIKVSFVLAIGAIAADFLWEQRHRVTKSDLARYLAYGVVGALALFLLLVFTQLLFPFFDLDKSAEYWKHFVQADRNWFQTFIQLAKGVLYLSPLLVLVPLFLKKRDLPAVRPFLFFIAFGLIFYVVLFDFSIGALDRYLQFLIVPLSAMSGVAMATMANQRDRSEQTDKFLALGVVVAIAIFLAQFGNHYVPSLHPKAEWISRALSFRWNFVYPFSGGSGPLGFYISFLFIGTMWVLSFASLVVGRWKVRLRKSMLLFLIPLGIVYNLTFAEEYLFGSINGSASQLLADATEYIRKNPDIEMVTVYNDNGGNEIRQIGKYRKRLYTDPAFDLNEKIATLNRYKEHYLEIDVPRIDPRSAYRKYLDSCNITYRKIDGKISATVYDCRNAPDAKI